MIRVDLHLHSDVSVDGYYAPTTLADKVAAAGVRYAALTDHQSLDGLALFAAVFARHGGVTIPGVEIHARHDDLEIHLLAYGFDPADVALGELVRRTPSAEEAIRIVHAAGGVVILAHPLMVSRDPDVLAEFVGDLRARGLDGIEALYSPYEEDEQRRLLDLADRLGLIISAGSDFHGPSLATSATSAVPGVEIEERRWKRFRDALPVFQETAGDRPSPSPPEEAPPIGRWFVLHIILPALLAITLFIGALFGALLPAIEENLMARKREMIRELTNSAWSILAAYDEDARADRLSLAAAQAQARDEIRRIRYGPEAKDYFWITDTTPRMVMHPWREDLNGEDLSTFRDPAGVALFVEFVRVVREREQGYVDYVWQWKDDPERLEPKESYVRIYRPWGWVIGTGIYIEDVEREIEAITHRLIDLSAAITILIGLILAYVIHQSYRLERRRRRVEADLRASHARYRLLVEASTEGTLMVVEARCAYANRTFLEMAGYSEEELPFLDLADLFPASEQKAGGERIAATLEGAAAPARFSTMLRRKNGRVAPVLVTPTRVEVYGRRGWILVLREEERSPSAEAHRPDGLSGLEALFVEPAVKQLRPLVASLLDAGVGARGVTRLVTDVSGAVTTRLLEVRLAEFGPPPVPFVFLVFGSEARGERTFLSDQDNGILFADPAAGEEKRVEEYFRRLGFAICDDLERAGYPRCQGESMARNPKWRRSLSDWQKLFTAWVREPNPEELLRFNIFFDQRALDGDPRLVAALTGHIDGLLAQAPSFYFHLAASAFRTSPSLDLFGRIVTDDPTGESGGIDLKQALLPVVSFARLYALRHRIGETNTLERLRLLETAGVIDAEMLAGLSQAHEFIMGLRLRLQAAPRDASVVDNRIEAAEIAAPDRVRLDAAFRRIAALRRRLEEDYPGAEKAGA